MSDPKTYTVGWISALPNEAVAARQFFDERHPDAEYVAQHDQNVYTLGRIGRHNVVMACLPKGDYGITRAATVANNMCHSFPNIRFGLMVGIGGGAPSQKQDIRLGDIVVSSRSGGLGGVFQYDYGKTIQNGQFEYTQHLNEPPQLLQAAVAALEIDYKSEGHHLDNHVRDLLEKNPRIHEEFCRPPDASDNLFRSGSTHKDVCGGDCGTSPNHLVARKPRGKYEDIPAIHYGLVASANQLMKDALVRDQLVEEKGVLCFEMEAAGLMNEFPCLVIRGICDYADSHKNKQWQGYAAMVAAAYAKQILLKILPNKVEAERPLGEALKGIEQRIDVVHQEVLEFKASHESVKLDQHTQKIRRWLSPPDPSTNANHARKLRHGGTGAWLLAHPVFQSWHSGSRRHLWLHGFAGCGKTVLSTTVLDHVAVDNDRLLLSFFFDFSDTTKQSVDGMLRSLAFQLYQSGSGSSVLDASFQAHQDGLQQPATKTLEDIVTKMLIVQKKVSIVLDALDESTTRSDLLSWIKDITSRTELCHVQLICTSRPEAEFLREIPATIGGDSHMRLDKQAVNDDIGSYVSVQLTIRQEFTEKQLSQDLLELIRNKVGGGADGMFRWAACQLDSLARCSSPRAVKAALDHLPEDLNETYERMLCNIPKDARNSATRLFHFLVCCDRPVTVPEAIEIIATDTEAEPPSFDVDGRVFGDNDVLRHGPSLISIVEVTQRQGGVRKELHLAHFSVKEFLQSRADFQQSRASVIITKTSLTYLSDITGAHNEIWRKFPMARLAAEIWTKHGATAENCEDTFRGIVKFLEDWTTFQRWGRLYQPDQAWKEDPGPPKGSRLYYACLGGLVGVARELIEKGANVNAEGGFYGNALQAASEGGHIEIVKLLLEKGANVNAEGGRYGNALYAASEGGHIEIVKLLLEKGANINAEGGNYGNALYAASEGGHIEIVKLLLEKGANVNAEGGLYGNALQAALEGGHIEIVKLLLEKGADVCLRDVKYGQTPLSWAAENGDEAVVRLLLAVDDTDVNTRDKSGRTLLSWAAANGHVAVVKLLLDSSRVDIESVDASERTALAWATTKGHEGVVKILLDACAATASNVVQSTLFSAAAKGHKAVVKMLIERNDVDVAAKDGCGLTALQLAVFQGHQAVENLLRACNAPVVSDFYGFQLLFGDETALSVASRSTE